jgi:hypothetical protein
MHTMDLLQQNFTKWFNYSDVVVKKANLKTFIFSFLSEFSAQKQVLQQGKILKIWP